MIKHVRRALLSYVALTAVLSTPAAFAQDVASKTVIETVVVTAERRDQSAQTVPISLTAIGGGDLDKMGVKSLAGLSQRVPSLRFGEGATGGENQIVLRGISNQNVTPFGEGSVSYNTDGIYVGRSTVVDPEFFDVQRIEVLRGPQGTLFGRNSVGGSINVVTNKPTNELSGHVDALLGDYNARVFRGWANVPLYDCGECQILFRMTGVSANHDPYQKNLSQKATATEGGDRQDYQMLRAHLLFKFNSDVDLLLSASTNTSKSPVAVDFPWYELPLANQSRFAGETPFTDPRKVKLDYPIRGESYSNFFAATFGWDLGFAKLTSTTSVIKSHWLQSSDGDGSDLPINQTPFWGSTAKQQSQEFRLQSNDDTQPLKWITGAYFFREYTDQTFYFEDTGFGPGGAFFAFKFDSPAYLVTRSWALFGQADYDLGKTSAGIPLTITAGLRYTHDNKYGYGDVLYNVPFLGPPPGTTFSSANDHNSNWAQITGKFGLSYRFTDDVMAYASVSKGYQAGGFLVVVYKPQSLWSYEAGLKSQWFDRRLQLNANVFRSEITDMQIFLQNIVGTRMENAGKAHVNGFELETIAVPVDGLTLNMEVSLMDAVYDSYFAFDNRTAAIAPVLEDNKGNRLNYTPKYTVNMGAEYALQTDIGTFTPRVDVFFSGDLYFAGANKALDRQSAYTFINLSLGYVEPKGVWTVDAFVHNLADKDVISNQTHSSSSNGLGIQINQNVYYPPRTVGVRFGVNF